MHIESRKKQQAHKSAQQKILKQSKRDTRKKKKTTKTKKTQQIMNCEKHLAFIKY